MHENDERTAGALSAVQPDLEYIPVCSDPRGVYMSGMYKEGAILKEIHIRIEQQSTLFEMMETFGRVVGYVACGGMIYVWLRTAGII